MKTKPKSTLLKLILVVQLVKNWHMLIKDKILGTQDLIDYKFRNGLKVCCRPKSTDINEAVVVMSGLEYPHKKFNHGEKKIVFDVGCNIGAFSLFIHHDNAGMDLTIYAFEPHPENVQMFNKNANTNKISNFKLIQKAMAGIDGKLNLDVSGGFDSFRLNSNIRQGLEVDAIRISTFCKQNHIAKIDLLKMDVEGAEYDIFEADLTFIKENIECIFMEYHLFSNNDQSRLDSLLNNIGDVFDIAIKDSHENGGIIIAQRKLILSKQ